MALCIAWAITLAFPLMAHAHARVVQANPADNATLKESPDHIQLEFTEPVSPQFSSFRVLDVNGRDVSHKAATLDAARQQSTLTLPKLGDGIYSVVWKVVSDRDGHITRGHTVFTVGTVTSSMPPSVSEDSGPSWMEVVLRWLNLIAITGLAGGFMVALMCLRGQFIQSLGLGWVALWSRVALVAGMGLLAQQVWSLTEPSTVDVTLIVNLLTQTSWGQAWLLRMFALVAFAVSIKPLLQPLRPPQAKLSIVAACSSIIFACIAQTIASHTEQSALAIGLQAVHVLAASVWMGGLAMMVLTSAMLLQRSTNNHQPAIQQMWLSFSRLALISMVALAVTGLLGTTKQVFTLDALLTTPYGKTLMVKGFIIVCVVLIAAKNRLALRQQATHLTRLLARARIEMLLGVGILAATALLTASSPANGPEFDSLGGAPVQARDSMSMSVDDLLITLSAKPNRPGPNVLSIVAASSRRPARAEVLRIMAKFTGPNAEQGETTAIAEKADVDMYRLGGNHFNMPGAWQVDVIVRRKGLEDVVARFDWHVPNAPITARPVLISNQPIERPLRVASGIMGLLGLMLVLAQFLPEWRLKRWHLQLPLHDERQEGNGSEGISVMYQREAREP